ncbi:MAG TPA: hypothetical protein VHX66_17980 [Solirubrobacteraceae bacterium]|jgi:hypothetical protein|nr:hypothetical protein [Solirubrobacteraceae bacterium]
MALEDDDEDEDEDDEADDEFWLCTRVEPLWLVVAAAALPWKALAATRASAPDSDTTAVATQRVVLDMRRNPASRATTARRAWGSMGGGSVAIASASFARGYELDLSQT